MPTVIATYPDGRVAQWKDGEITGYEPLLWSLERVAKSTDVVSVTPEGPFFAGTDYETEPWAFLALAQLGVDHYGVPTLESSGLPTIGANRPEDGV